jgi:hypothetical protein
LNLSFKIILIQKSQVSIFVRYLKLFEFENVFGLKLSFEFKFKISIKEFAKQFLFFSLASPKPFGPSPSTSSMFDPSNPLLPSSPSLRQQCRRRLLATAAAALPPAHLPHRLRFLSRPRPFGSPLLDAVSMHETKALKSSTIAT